MWRAVPLSALRDDARATDMPRNCILAAKMLWFFEIVPAERRGLPCQSERVTSSVLHNARGAKKARRAMTERVNLSRAALRDRQSVVERIERAFTWQRAALQLPCHVESARDRGLSPVKRGRGVRPLIAARHEVPRVKICHQARRGVHRERRRHDMDVAGGDGAADRIGV